MTLLDVPVGQRRFHRQAFFDYQLARAYGLGLADGDELDRVVGTIRRRDDLVATMHELAATAESEGRLRHALGYARVEQFFRPHGSPERIAAYGRVRHLFDHLTVETDIVRVEVPYQGAVLPAYRVPARRPHRGTVLFHGGFDSLIEEFCAIWERIADAGYDVVAFDGPGQGGAFELGGLTFEHDWEHAVGAILDHLELSGVTLVGLSMGGYWALRAAGREPRIARVVSWPPVYDWLAVLPGFARTFVRGMVRLRGLMNVGIRFRMWLFPILDHVVRQAMAISGGTQPMDAVDWMLGMNAEHLGSERVRQDVLLMAGAEDAFQPPRLARMQERALVNARSVRVRTFTADEQAAQHCQLSNVPLAVRVLTGWLEESTRQPAADERRSTESA